MSVESGCHLVLLLEPQKSFQSSIWSRWIFSFIARPRLRSEPHSQRDMSAELVRYQCHVQAQKVGRRFDQNLEMGAKRKSTGGDPKNSKAAKKDGTPAKVAVEPFIAEICKWQLGCN